MIWDSWSDFFAMGGYALYVWGSVFMAAICMLGELVSLVMRRKAILNQLKATNRRHAAPKGGGRETTA
jgi:heme exporter protein D